MGGFWQLEELLKREPGLMRERFSGAAYDDGVKQMAEAVLGRAVGPLTALQLACLYESEAAAEWLLQRLPVSAVDDTWGDGCTTLHLAAFHGMVATVAGLLERGARAGVRNGVGFVPVDCAADDETRNTFLAAAARAPPPIRTQRSLTQLIGTAPSTTAAGASTTTTAAATTATAAATAAAAATSTTTAAAVAVARDVAEEAPAESANKLAAAAGPAPPRLPACRLSTNASRGNHDLLAMPRRERGVRGLCVPPRPRVCANSSAAKGTPARSAPQHRAGHPVATDRVH